MFLVVGVSAAGWFGYQEYQDQQDRDAADRAAAADDDRSASEILDDLGSQGEMLNAQDALNDAMVPDVGGLGSAIDDARDVVGGINGDAADPDAPGADATPTPFTYDVVVPAIVRTAGERFADPTGRETYVIGTDQFAQGDPDAFALFLRLMSVQPQLVPDAEAFADLPEVATNEIVISVLRTGDRVDRAIVVGESIDLHVDVTP